MTFTFTNKAAKRLISFSFLLLPLFVGSLVSGQIKTSYGPKIGANVSVFRGEMKTQGMRKPHYGFTGGAYFMVRSQKQKRWQFEANLLYTTRGNYSEFFNIVDNDPKNDDYKTKVNYSMGYIEVPLLMKYMLNKGGMTRPYLFFGPVYGGLIHAKLTDKTNNARESNAFEWITRDDFGLMVGWGITSFYIDRWFHLDVRLYNGFSDISDNLAKDIQPFRSSLQDRAQFYNSTLSITVGVGLERSETFFLR